MDQARRSSPDGDFFVTGGTQTKFFRVRDLRPLGALAQHLDSGAHALAISPSGTTLAQSAWDGMRVYSLNCCQGQPDGTARFDNSADTLDDQCKAGACVGVPP